MDAAYELRARGERTAQIKERSYANTIARAAIVIIIEITRLPRARARYVRLDLVDITSALSPYPARLRPPPSTLRQLTTNLRLLISAIVKGVVIRPVCRIDVERETRFSDEFIETRGKNWARNENFFSK